MNQNSEIGEHTRPRVWLDAPSRPASCARMWQQTFESFRCARVFREGAENRTRGGCAPQLRFRVQ